MPERADVTVPGGRFAYLEAGRRDAPLALCLHGFPDHPWTFEGLLEPLAAAGFHAVAPWLRGYVPSTLAGPHTIDRLAADAIELADALSPDAPAALIGHDWGAVATYAATARAPGRFRRAVVMAVPHPAAFAHNLRRDPAQIRRSWYKGHIQHPGAAALVRRNDLALVDRLWRAWSPELTPPAAYLRALKDCLAASLPAPIRFYRPAALGAIRRLARTRIAVPTLHLHGALDGCISPSMAAGQERYFAATVRTEIIPGAGHFLWGQDARVRRAVVGWLRL